MSFAFLKNLVLRQPKQQVYNQIKSESFEAQSWNSSPTLSSSGSQNGDVESQQLRKEITEKLPPPAKKEEAVKYKIDPRVISDAIIGLSDGLTVPFALTAGLSAIGSTKVVVYGGMAELIAGAISMGLGGYLGAKSERSVSITIPVRCSA